MQSTTGKLPAGKGHYSQSTSGQKSNGLSTTGNAMVGKIPRGQRDWQATYDRPGFRSMKNCVAQKKGFVKNLNIFALIKSLEIICSKTLERKVCNLKSAQWNSATSKTQRESESKNAFSGGGFLFIQQKESELAG